MKKSVLTLLCAAHILLLSSCSFWLNPLLGLDGTGREDDSSGAVKTAKGELTSGSSVDVWSFDVSSTDYYYIWLNRNYSSATAQCELSYVAGYTYQTAKSDNCYTRQGYVYSSDDYSGAVYSKIGDGKIYIFVKPYGSYSTYAGKYSLSVTTDSTYSPPDRVKLTKVDTTGLTTNVYSDYTHGYIKSSEGSETYKQ